MLVRPKLAGALATLVASAVLFLAACSSSQPRDISYGTDVGANYVPPDAPATSSDDAAQSTSEVSDDSAAVVKGGAIYDASIDADE